MDRKTTSLVTLGSSMIRESFEALHSSVSSDRATLSRVTCGWPSILLELTDLKDQEDLPVRKHFTSWEVSRAERRCDIFTGMTRYSPVQKQAAVTRALWPHLTWKTIAKRLGYSWQWCRDAHDSVSVSFVYVLADAEGIEIEPVVAIPQAQVSCSVGR